MDSSSQISDSSIPWSLYTNDFSTLGGAIAASESTPIYTPGYSGGDMEMRSRSPMDDILLGGSGLFGSPVASGGAGYETPKRDMMGTPLSLQHHQQQQQMLSPSSTLSPPVPIRQTLRRAVSTGALPTISNPSTIAAGYPYQQLQEQQPPTPALSSPASDALQTPRDGQLVPQGGPSWFASAQDNFLQQHNLQQNSSSQGYQSTSAGPSQPYLLASPTSSNIPQPSTSSIASSSRRMSVTSPPGTTGLGGPMDLTGPDPKPGQHRRKRRSVAHGVPLQGSTSSSGSRYPRNLSITVPPAGAYQHLAPYSAPAMPVSQQMVQAPSVEEVNQFFADIGELLGPETMAALSPPRAMSTQGYTTSPPTFAAGSSSTPTSRPSGSSGGGGVFNVSGVLLEQEDLDMLAQDATPVTSSSNTPTQYPSSAPAYRTTFNQPSAYLSQLPSTSRSRGSTGSSHQPQHTFQYSVPSLDNRLPQSQPLLHPIPLAGTAHPGTVPPYGSRPRSAPASPDLGSGGFQSFQPMAYFDPSSQHQQHSNQHHHPQSSLMGFDPATLLPHQNQGSAQLLRRRGSSMDGMVPPSSAAVIGRTGYEQSRSQQHQGQMYGQERPGQYYQAAQQQGYAQYPTTPTRRSVGPYDRRPLSSSPSPKKPSSRQGGAAPMFINFSSSDAKVLLNGVAPSGSSKGAKRKREDEEI